MWTGFLPMKNLKTDEGIMTYKFRLLDFFWKDKDRYVAAAKDLSCKFKENFKLYGKEVAYLINYGAII